MEGLSVEISIIKAILACPRKYPDKSSSERFVELEKQFPNNDDLFTYFDFPNQTLQDILKVLLEKELKFGTIAGAHLLLVLLI